MEGARGIAALLLPTSTIPDSMSILESPRSLQMNPDAADRMAPSSRFPQIIVFSSSDHLKICGSIRFPQKPIISPLLSELTNGNSARIRKCFDVPSRIYVINCSYRQLSFPRSRGVNCSAFWLPTNVLDSHLGDLSCLF